MGSGSPGQMHARAKLATQQEKKQQPEQQPKQQGKQEAGKVKQEAGKNTTRAERRAVQERQRAEKLAAKASEARSALLSDMQPELVGRRQCECLGTGRLRQRSSLKSSASAAMMCLCRSTATCSSE